MITIKRSFPKKKKGEPAVTKILITAETAYELYALTDIFDFFGFDDNPWDNFTSEHLPKAEVLTSMECANGHDVAISLEITDLSFSINTLMIYIGNQLDNTMFDLEFNIQN